MSISPPVVTELPYDDTTTYDDDTAIKIRFRMEIADLLKSDIVQIMSADLGAKLADAMGNMPGAAQTEAAKAVGPTVKDVESMDYQRTEMENGNKVDIKAVKYQSFDSATQSASQNIDINISSNMDLIVDVPLQVTVLLGKSRKSIKDILDMNMGSVIVLDRLAGEKVDVLVNGKMFAHGEVVVIDDNYGVRVTDIVSASSD